MCANFNNKKRYKSNIAWKPIHIIYPSEMAENSKVKCELCAQSIINNFNVEFEATKQETAENVHEKCYTANT